MERLLRITALATAGVTLVWLSGCGGSGSDATSTAPKTGIAAEIEARNAAREAEEQAAAEAAAASERERRLAETPSAITKDDYKRGSVAKTGGRVASALGGALAAGEDIQLKNLQHQMELHSINNGWPESHEAFLKLVNGWGMTLPPLVDGYEYWYDAQTHEILKRPIVAGREEE